MADARPPSRRTSDQTKRCAACEMPMALDSKVCAGCGYDERAGFQAGRGVGATATRGGVLKCPNCGYSLGGLRSPKCPECGTLVSKIAESLKRREREERQFYRRETIIPIAVSVAACAAVLGMFVSVGTFDSAVAALARLALNVALATALYFGLVLVWLGFDSPGRIILLRVVAAAIIGQFAMLVVCTTGLVGLLAFVPIGMLAIASMLALMALTRRDLTECLIVAVVWALAWYITEFALLYALDGPDFWTYEPNPFVRMFGGVQSEPRGPFWWFRGV